MILDLTPDELLTTTRAVRKRLDLTRPVERSVIEECLEIALQAPTGSNNQGWQWVFVEDADKKRQIADWYREVFANYADAPKPNFGPDDVRTQRREAVTNSASFLAEHFHEAPMLVIPCHIGRVDGADAHVQAGYWGSILPAVWSFMLALRSRGLGSAWTTMHLAHEKETAE